MSLSIAEQNKQFQHQLAVKREAQRIRQYERTIKYRIMTTRFNNETAEQNRLFRERKKIPNYCVYGTPVQISNRIIPDTKMIVLEMNNEQNKIIGIGLLLNRVDGNSYNIYSNPSYNRYCYIGKDRITREELTEEEELTMKIFDKLCFEGPLHSKRGQGLRAFPTKMLYRCLSLRNLEQELVTMFKKRTQQIKSKN